MTAPAVRSPAWHDLRRGGIGGSDIPILAGLSPYDKGPHDLYLEKRGDLEPSEPSEYMEVGQVIEDAIAILYTRRTGRKVTRANVLARHPDYPWAIGNLDRKVRGERRLVEIKNRRAWRKADGLPADVECQVQWYLGVTRYPVADVAMLVGGNDLRIVEVTKDEAYFRDLLVIAGEFWKRVQDGNPPDLDGSAAAARYLANRYPWHQGDDLAPADGAMDHLAGELRQALDREKVAKAASDLVEQAIKSILGETPGVQGQGYRITWKRSADYTRTDWEAVARFLEPSDHLVATHTKTIEGTRRFVARFEGNDQ